MKRRWLAGLLLALCLLLGSGGTVVFAEEAVSADPEYLAEQLEKSGAGLF